ERLESRFGSRKFASRRRAPREQHSRAEIPRNPGTESFFGTLIHKQSMRGDMDLERLADQHYAPLYRFALSLCANESDACDLVQETFYLLATKGHQLDDLAKVKSWLFTTLYRLFLGRRRRLVRFPHHELD